MPSQYSRLSEVYEDDNNQVDAYVQGGHNESKKVHNQRDLYASTALRYLRITIEISILVVVLLILVSQWKLAPTDSSSWSIMPDCMPLPKGENLCNADMLTYS